MRGCETKNKKNAAYTTLTTSFIPRQLLLSSSSSKSTMAQQKKEATTVSLSSEDRLRLLQTVCQFLELNGFVKTLKKFRSEADIEDCRKNCSVNLEEMFQEYLRKSNEKELDLKSKSAKHVPYVKTDGKPMENGVDGDDIKPKKKKKNKIADDTSDQVEDTLSEPSEAVKKFKKKKQKDASEPMDEDLKQQPVEDTSEPVKKSKDKKKKHKGESEVSAKDVQEKDAAVAAEETPRKADGVPVEEKKEKSKKSKEIKEDVSTSKDENEELGKRSKKRKQSSSDDTATGYIEESATDDPKRRKMDDSDNTNEAAQAQKIPDGTANGFLEKDGGQKALKQDRTKEHTGSSEPTSAKAFQRVKADQVEFIDDRLKNNSYWAKDGADSGYGAKAQEILGQVRGRDFRHEKTKKKRGSYRGGQIDLQSHSIKFNYDDDDE